MLSWVGTAGKKNRSHLLAEGMARAGWIRAGFISRAPPSAGPRGHGQGLASASRAPMTALRGRAPCGRGHPRPGFPGACPWSPAAAPVHMSESRWVARAGLGQPPTWGATDDS